MDLFWHDVALFRTEGLRLAGMALTALVCGALLGFERQRKGKPVGVLTASLVALGSASVAYSGTLWTDAMGPGGDVTRLASMIVTGIGFIGAGTILRSKFNVTGLASAATIWGLGGLGILIGSGHALLALALALLFFLLLRAVPHLEHRLFRGRFCLHATLVVERQRMAELAAFLWDHQLTTFRAEPRDEDGLLEVLVDECGFEARAGLVHVLQGLKGVVEVVDRRR